MRNAIPEDLDDLYKLSGKANFINLPHDKTLIEENIKTSLASFKKPSKDYENNYFIFVLEDLLKNKVVGASMIHAQHGTEKEPHFFLKVSEEKKYSSTINTGFVHGTLKLGLETNGPSEIGGLVLDPQYRGHKDKLGKQISFVRFLFISLYPQLLKGEIHSELMPPFDKDGKSPLWEALGRRFMNMNYDEADKLSRFNKEFILSLFPSDNIYMTLLPIEARDAIGKVGKETEPVKKMLEDIGFHYINEVDPFDGGPHYRAQVQDIKPIREKIHSKIEFQDSHYLKNYLVELKNTNFNFCAGFVRGNFDSKKNLLQVESQFKNLFKEYDSNKAFNAIPI